MVECAPDLQIQPLGTNLVHRIAAGEVIDSLGAVVRELLDNALDAGADRISVSLWPQDWRIQVVDNGQGLTAADLSQAATPHTTSKLQREEDLWDIQTLGFRGEALHSLAQMGRLEICSRPLGSAQGCRVRYDHQGHVVAQETVAIATGTVVTVADLFQDWPTRKQALPDPARQMRGCKPSSMTMPCATLKSPGRCSKIIARGLVSPQLKPLKIFFPSSWRPCSQEIYVIIAVRFPICREIMRWKWCWAYPIAAIAIVLIG